MPVSKTTFMMVFFVSLSMAHAEDSMTETETNSEYDQYMSYEETATDLEDSEAFYCGSDEGESEYFISQSLKSCRCYADCNYARQIDWPDFSLGSPRCYRVVVSVTWYSKYCENYRVRYAPNDLVKKLQSECEWPWRYNESIVGTIVCKQ